MNLTWHIIKKDLRHRGAIIGLWAVCGIGTLMGAHVDTLVSNDSMAPRIVMIALLVSISSLIWSLLTLTLIAMIVQDDDVTEDKVFWRTRPISARRLLIAKMSTIFTLFLVLPLVAFRINEGIKTGSFDFTPVRWLPALTMGWCAIGLATCTRGLAQFFVSIFLCFITGGILTWTSMLIPRLKGTDIGIQPFIVVTLYCIALASAVILNQYFKRNLRLSISLIAIAIVGTVTMSTCMR